MRMRATRLPKISVRSLHSFGVGDTSRELRVWPQQQLLIVMNFQCSALLHACASTADANGSQVSNFKFYDLSKHPANPQPGEPKKSNAA